MKFQFNVNFTENDYIEFNKFQLLRSQYGKKRLTNYRIALAVITCIGILVPLIVGRFRLQSFISCIPLLILCSAFLIFIKPLLALSVKGTIKAQKKNGKIAYSPTSVLEFYDDVFIETTETNKTEQKYPSVERICIVDNKIIYIFINNIVAYTLPFASFKGKEEYVAFIAFIKTKCNNIEVYNQ